MLRNDGNYVIYIIQHLSGKNGWIKSSLDYFAVNIPVRLRWNKMETEILQPYRSFSACGSCWQMTGIEGSLCKKTAIRFMNQLRKYNPHTKFRVACIRMSQFTEPI